MIMVILVLFLVSKKSLQNFIKYYCYNFVVDNCYQVKESPLYFYFGKSFKKNLYHKLLLDVIKCSASNEMLTDFFI